MGIKAKILTPALVIILAVAIAVTISNIVLFSGFVDDSTVDRVDVASRVAANSLDALKAEARAVSLSMARHPDIAAAVENADRAELLVRARALQDESGVEVCTITDPKGVVIARTHEPDHFGDSILQQTNIQSAIYGEPLTVIEEGNRIRMSVRSSAPVFNTEGAVIGVVSAGFRLDTEAFVDMLKETVGCETTIVLGDERIASTVMGKNGVRIVGTKADAHIAETVLAGNDYSGRVDIEGETAVCKYTPIDGPDGTPIGMIFVGEYLEEETKTIASFVQGGSVILFAMLAASTVIILLVVGRIVRPIHAMTAAASALAVGDTELDIQIHTKDEMRTLADAFNSMVENTRRQVRLIESVAGGDMTITLEPRSEKDLMNRALEKLNATIKAQDAEIREEHERVRLLLDATPMVSCLWDRDYNLIECNEAAVLLFGLKDKQEYIDRYDELSPEYQPDGRFSREKSHMLVKEAFEKGVCAYDWVFQLPDGTPIPAEATMVRVPYGNDYIVARYFRDLREQKKMLADIEHRDELLQIVNAAADNLLRSEPAELERSLQQALAMMARGVGADRMRVIKNHTAEGLYYHTLLHEWREHVPPLKNTAFTDKISYHDTTPGLLETMLRREYVHSGVKDMPSSDRKWFQDQGIFSVLIFPVFIGDEFWGIVGFDNCHDERLFTETEVSLMHSGGMIVANALLRGETILDLRDASAQLKIALADAKAANSAKSSFLAQMSHEIRTPLNAVVGLSELALDNEQLDGELGDYLEKIHTSGITILSIVNDILDISKIESGKFELYPAQYDTPSLINDIVTLNIVRIGEKPIIFRLFIDDRLPGTLFGDDLRVKQIFNNLLSNAFKYTHSGTVEWRVAFERDGGDAWLISSVRDTGIGMKPESVRNVFAEYNQVDDQTNRKVEGTGLGLAITKRLVEMMDGEIAVESTYGQGTTFSVRLKQSFVSDTPIGKEVAENLMGLRYTLSKRGNSAKLSRVDLSYAHILVVDDIPNNLDVVKGMMKPYKVQIDCVSSGPQAISMIRAGEPRYSAIFMDHMMPEMDGLEATRIIREEIGTEYARNIPIIALTANAIVGNEEMFLSQGFQAFLSKPVDIAKLDAVLRYWVRDKGKEKDGPHDTELEETGAGTAYPLFADVDINGIEKEKALERFGGDHGILFDVLRSYLKGTRPALKKRLEFLESGNLRDYAIAVHGLKGSSRAVGARAVGDLAEALEREATEGNYDAVSAGHPIFAADTEVLLGEIGRALETIDTDSGKPVAASPSPALLEKLRKACAAFDMDGVDAAMERLASFRYESGGDLIAWLKERVGEMAFEDIIEMEIPEPLARSSQVEKSGTFIAPEAELLLADDSQPGRDVVLGLLKPLQMRIDTAENGEAAWEMATRKKYDLILMDYRMPVMDGVESVGKLRNTEGAASRTAPVVALTAGEADSRSERVRQDFMEAGASGYVTKPLSRDDLFAVVKRWLPAGLLREADAAEPPPAEQAGLPVIEGVNAEEGVRFTGSKELYLNLLRDVYRLIDRKSTQIEQLLADGMLKEFTVETHALKSIARMMGNPELAEGFGRLEDGGRDGDSERLAGETSAVLEKLRSLKPLLRPYGEPSAEKRFAAREEIITLLQDIEAAMDSFRLDEADAAMGKLERCRLPVQCAAQMETLRAYMADVAMAEAMELARVMAETIENLPEEEIF